MAPPIVIPPGLVPSPARGAGEVYLCSIRYCAPANMSSIVCCLVSFWPAKCQSSLQLPRYSPADRFLIAHSLAPLLAVSLFALLPSRGERLIAAFQHLHLN